MPRYKKNKDGYFRETFVIPGKTEAGNPRRIIIRDRDEKVFRLKLDEAHRLYGKGVTLEDVTVADWAQRWLQSYKNGATPDQKEFYEAKIKNDILPHIGHFLIRDIKASDLQGLLNIYTGGRKGTVQKIKMVIKQLFAIAEIEGIIDRNPASRIEMPNITEFTRRPLTMLERLAIFEVAKTHNHGPYIMTMLFCGLRRGECIVLKVGDVDFENLRIRITKSLKLRKNIGVKKEPKTKAGTRYVPIPDLLLPYLQAQCSGKSKDDILFPKANGKFATSSACKRWWESVKRSCHIMTGAETKRNKALIETSQFCDDITLHYIRHNYATDLYSAGVDEKAQEFFLGHKSGKVTDIYRKMTKTAFNRALVLINEYNSSLCYSLLPTPRTPETFKYCSDCPYNQPPELSAFDDEW